MASRKPKDLRDILEAVAGITGSKKPARKSSSAMASAYVATGRNAQQKIVKKASNAGDAFYRGGMAATKAVLGDPKKGWKDVAYNTGTWIIPYSKGFKVVDATVKGAKYYKTAKAVRGAIKGATLLGAPVALEKALKALPQPNKKRQNIAVPKKMKGK